MRLFFFLALRLIVRKPAVVPALQDGGLVVSDEEKEKTAPTSLKAAPSKPPPSLQAAPSDSSAPGLSNSAPSD